MSCTNGSHQLIDIYRHGYEDEEVAVVRWCTECGAVVVDVDMDGRIAPGHIMKMRFPKSVYQL